MTDLFDPCELNGLKLQNRIALSPVTRTRADMEGRVGELQAIYYAQRASAGLLITEATAAPSPPACGTTAMSPPGKRSPMRCTPRAA